MIATNYESSATSTSSSSSSSSSSFKSLATLSGTRVLFDIFPSSVSSEKSALSLYSEFKKQFSDSGSALRTTGSVSSSLVVTEGQTATEVCFTDSQVVAPCLISDSDDSDDSYWLILAIAIPLVLIIFGLVAYVLHRKDKGSKLDHMNDTEITALFKEFDVDHDGGITQEEFVAGVHRLQDEAKEHSHHSHSSSEKDGKGKKATDENC